MSDLKECEVHEATAPRIETVLATVYTQNTPQIFREVPRAGALAPE